MAVSNNNKLPLAGFVITFLACVLFSTKAIIVKKAFAGIHTTPLSLLAVRMLFSLPFYVVAAFFVSRQKSNIQLTRREWTQVIVVGVLGYYLSSFFDFVGLLYISAGLERLILFLYPTFAIILNSLLFKQRITGKQKLALALTYVGIGIAYFGELKIDTSNQHFYWGSFLVFLCSITYSLYLVGSGRLIPKIGATKFTAYAMLAATIGVLVHFMLAGEYENFQVSNSLIKYGLLLSLLATVLPSFMLSYGMKTIGGNNTAILTSIGPVSTILQAHFLLGDPILVEQVVGTFLVVAGVILIGWKATSSVE